MKDFLLQIYNSSKLLNDNRNKSGEIIFKKNNFKLTAYGDYVSFDYKNSQIFIFGHIDYINFSKKKNFHLKIKIPLKNLKKIL